MYQKQVNMEIQIFICHHSELFTQEWPLGFSLERKPTSLLLMSVPCIILKNPTTPIFFWKMSILCHIKKE